MPEEIEVPTEHLQEKLEEAVEEAEHERSEHKRERAWVSRVAVSSALLAVAAAISALLAGHHANEAMFEEMKATDKWALYQAKGIKQSQLETKVVLLTALGKTVPPEKDKGANGKVAMLPVDEKIAKYEEEKAEIQTEAKHEEESANSHMAHHVWFARAVTVFQIAIAMGAIAVLAKRPKLWLVSVGLGALGAAFLAIGLV